MSTKHVLCNEGEDSDSDNLNSCTTWQAYPVGRVISVITIAYG